MGARRCSAGSICSAGSLLQRVQPARSRLPAVGRSGGDGLIPSQQRYKTLSPCCILPGLQRGGPAAGTPRGSSALLGVPSSAGCHRFCISYASVYFFSLALETRRMFLSLLPCYIAIKLPSKAQWWQEKTNVTLPPARYELLCIPFPEKASCPFLNLGYN